MDAATRRTLIDRYRHGPAAVREALGEAPLDADLDRAAPDGGWSARRVVHHLADSETTSYIRLRRLLAETEPVIAPYDEEEFARVLHYDRPIAASLAVLDAVRAASAELLERLSASDFARAGTHPDHGRYSVDDWLEIYADHAEQHAAQIRSAMSTA